MKGDVCNGEMEVGCLSEGTRGQECGGLIQYIGLSPKARLRWCLRTVGVLLKKDFAQRRKCMKAPGHCKHLALL